MMIVALTYNGDTVEIELEEEGGNFGRELSSMISSGGGSGSGSGSGSSSPGFVDRETPSGSVNGVNVTFTLSQTPVAASEHFYRNGQLQQSGAGNDYTISSTTITCATAPVSGDVLLVSYRTSSGTTNFVDRETPSGTINGSNVTFTLAHTPTTGSLHLFLNGVLQNEGASNDYTFSGTTITMNTAPPTGSVLLGSYRY